MLYENSKMKAVETFHRSPKIWGIGEIMTSYANSDVAINGNFCFASNITKRPRPGSMTDKCHGSLVSGSVQSPASSTGGTSPYEGPQADHISASGFGTIEIKTGVVPLGAGSSDEALGGFASKLEKYGWHPWYGIGESGNQKIFFVATPTTTSSQGGAASFKQKLEDSGVPALPGGLAGEIQCIAGDGGTSLALAYRVGSLMTFFSNQSDWVIADEAVCSTAEQLAELQFAASVIASYSAIGDAWFGEWVRNIATAPDSNLKWLTYWSIVDFGEELAVTEHAPIRVIDWQAWRTVYSSANLLGKAIILKCLSSLGQKTREPEEIDHIQSLAFADSSEALKAIAIASGSNASGASIQAEWNDLAANSSNPKLKALAAEAIALYGPSE